MKHYKLNHKRVLITEKNGLIYSVISSSIKLLGLHPKRYTTLKDLIKARKGYLC